MAQRQQLEGAAELTAKLRELASPKEQASTLRASVRDPMRKVMAKFQVNLAALSPGDRQIHRTYKGRLVTSGFAARSVRMLVKMSRDKQSATAILGVLAEAFYILQFFELGTSKIQQHPTLEPAFRSSESSMLQGVADTMKKRIDRIAKKRGAR